MFSGLLGFGLYMLPSIVAWYRQKQGKSIVLSLGFLVVMNFFIAWTVLGWFLLMANALGYNPVAAVAPGIAKFAIKYGRVQGVPAQQGGATPGGGSAPCGQCGGSGRSGCPSCGGTGQSWSSGSQQQCSFCIGSGRVQCMSCSGTGRAQALI